MIIPVIWSAVNLMTFITEYRRAERVGTGTVGNLCEQVCLQTDQVAGPSVHAENGVLCMSLFQERGQKCLKKKTTKKNTLDFWVRCFL